MLEMVDQNSKQVLVIGLGYVGLTLGVHLAKHGFIVYGVEINKEILESCKKRKAPFYEPGLDSLLKDFMGSRFFVSEQVPEKEFDYILISVGTPLGSDKHPNLSYLEGALASIRPFLKKKTHIILRSTVSVGTTRTYVAPLMKKQLGLKDEEILLSFCPERTVEGKALEELSTLPQLVASYNAKSYESARLFFSKISPTIYTCPSLEAAELAKLFNNVYRDINFAVGNLFSRIAQSFGIDGNEMIDLANKGYDRSAIPRPGFVGGACLEKDAYILACNTNIEAEKLQIISHRQYNESLVADLTDWIRSRIEKGGRLLMSGLAFKGKPKTSDIRGSLAVNLVQALEKDYDITVHDFCATEKDLERIGKVKVLKNLSEENKPYDLFIILNNADQYLELTPNELKGIIEQGKTIVFDSWNVLSATFRKDFKFFTLGNYRIHS